MDRISFRGVVMSFLVVGMLYAVLVLVTTPRTRDFTSQECHDLDSFGTTTDVTIGGVTVFGDLDVAVTDQEADASIEFIPLGEAPPFKLQLGERTNVLGHTVCLATIHQLTDSPRGGGSVTLVVT